MKPDMPVTRMRTGRPVQGALAAAGIETLRDLARWTEADVLALHGVGPKGVTILRDALSEAGLTFRSSKR